MAQSETKHSTIAYSQKTPMELAMLYQQPVPITLRFLTTKFGILTISFQGLTPVFGPKFTKSKIIRVISALMMLNAVLAMVTSMSAIVAVIPISCSILEAEANQLGMDRSSTQ